MNTVCIDLGQTNIKKNRLGMEGSNTNIIGLSISPKTINNSFYLEGRPKNTLFNVNVENYNTLFTPYVLQLHFEKIT